MKRLLPEANITPEMDNSIKAIADKCKLLPETVRILYGRGIDTADKIDAFIHPSKAHFISPFQMRGMAEAVQTLKEAKKSGLSVVVYGDYDADGICAATILSSALRDFGIEPHVYVPERKDGYGLSRGNIDLIFAECSPKVFITVDCGISNAEEVAYIQQLGAEVVVTDHHELPDVLPDCTTINPKFDDEYPYDNLCGAGVAFKLSCALIGEKAYKYLDFAAIATVADSVPLLGENRDIVAEGLALINRNPRPCYAPFLARSEESITSQSLAFSVAPRINAAGRMGEANAALKLFTAKDKQTVDTLTTRLNDYNQERQRKCDEMYLSAKSKIGSSDVYSRILMLWDESWNTGFVGIVAARLAEEYGKPCLLFVKNGDLLKGSARSIEAVNIFEALKSCSQFIKEFGGHSQAAGVNIELDDFENLKNALNDYLTDKYSFESFTPTIYTCKNVEPKKCVRFAKEIELLEPFGVGNKRPMFVREEKVCAVRPIKKQSPHLLIKCEGLDFMYFNGAKSAKLLLCGAPKKLVFEYNVSSFRGKEQVKGFVRDIVYEGKELRCAAEMIALNNVLSFSDSYANPNFNRVTNLLLHNELARDIEPYGTIFIANDYQTLDSFPEAKKYPVELFNLTSRNLANTVLVSPETDVDLTGFVRIFWLDNPRRVSIRSTAGKLVQVAESLKNSNRTILGLDCDRKNLLAFYNELVTSLPNIEGENIFEVALKNKFSVSAAQAAFALGVFFELGLLSFEDERLTIYRGIKTNLSQSELYQRVKTEIENYENTLKVIEENK